MKMVISFVFSVVFLAYRCCDAIELNGKFISSLIDDSKINAIKIYYVNDYEDKIICVSFSDNNVESAQKRLIFYKKVDNNYKLIHQYYSDNNMVDLTQLHGELLYSIWETGTAYSIVVFNYSDNKIIEALNTHSNTFPSFIDIDEDGNSEIIISDEKMLSVGGEIIKRPSRAIVYKLVGKHFKKLMDVPWPGYILKKGPGKAN